MPRLISGGRIFISTHDNHFYRPGPDATAASCGINQGIRGIRRHPGVHQCGGVGRDRDRALYLRRNLRPARAERPGGLERCVVAQRPCHRAVGSWTTIAGRPVIDRGVVYAISQSGLMAAYQRQHRRTVMVARCRRHPDPLGGGRLYVYVLDNNARLICLTRKEGKVHWIHQLPQYENPDVKKGRSHHLGRPGADIRQAGR